MPTQIESLLLITFFISVAMAFFHYRDLYLEKRNKRNIKNASARLDKDLRTDFNSIEEMARVSITAKEKEEVDRLIDIFSKQYSHYSETRYNVQILQCINRMRNKAAALTYKFEFQN